MFSVEKGRQGEKQCNYNGCNIRKNYNLCDKFMRNIKSK